ncbi:MAG: hypothetical protein RL136_360 [Planctomycetota bacterium]|jgi:hypothetical protein
MWMLAQAAMDSDARELGLLLGILAAFGLLFAIGWIISVICTFFLWNSYRSVPQEHRKLAPGLVWLCLVPCVGFIMTIVCSVMIPQAFQAAFAARGRTDQGDCGMMLGLIGSVGMVVGSAIPIIGPFVALGCLVVFIVFLVRLAGCKRLIEAAA